MTWLLGALIFGSGFLAGWAVRGSLDSAIYQVMIKVLSSAVGQDVAAEKLKRFIEKEGPKHDRV